MKILFISTWFPYPPSQGSKIRAFHLIQALARKHQVGLVSFLEPGIEKENVEAVEKICSFVKTIPRDPYQEDPRKALLGFFSPRPSVVTAIYSAEMADLVRKTALEWGADCVAAQQFVMAPYAMKINGVPKILDLDFLMARVLYEDFIAERRWLARMRKWMAYKKFEHYEKSLCEQFDGCFVVSDEDAAGIQRMIARGEERVKVIPNGVDLSHYRLGVSEPAANTLIYNGSLTYAANFDAMEYFLREIFPLILRQIPETRLRITGKTDGMALDRLNLNAQVEFTGYLDDIREAVSGSWASVIPLRIGGGTRLKILEAMALGTAVVSTSKGAEGLLLESEKHLLIADDPAEFAAQTVRVLQSPELRFDLVGNAAQLVRERYNWEDIGYDFCLAVEEIAARSRSHA